MSEYKVPVSEYLNKHQLQKLIEDAVNQCYKTQSSNPTAFMASFFSQKTNSTAIHRVVGREVLDSRGNPTVEADIYLADGKLAGRASAPSGASTGSNEAHELRDTEDKKRYHGKGVQKAVSNVSGPLSDALKGKNVDNLRECDLAMREKDGTELKTNLGGNAITAASFAVATAGASVMNEELFLYLARNYDQSDNIHSRTFKCPTPLVNILNGGKHAGGRLKIQEFMIVPSSEISFKEQLRTVTEVYHTLGGILSKACGKSAKNLGDEGGYAPSLENPNEALAYIKQAIEEAGYTPGRDVFLALDAAASEFYDKETNKYEIIEGQHITSEALVDFYEKMVDDYPFFLSIEDGLDEKDYEGWKKMTERLGSRIMIVGDDLYTTNTRLIKEGIENKWANALLLKVNQIGTISESMDAARMIQNADQNVIVSHRSGETGTNIIADLAVAIGAKYIKTGAPARGERVGKYNRLLQIEEYLKDNNLLKQ
ncbi:enolase [Acrasis kona]|uniref:phosphopyruvate hydratase n=1 Tax=Acrasis kona TaxID=1008807 RepID=A0AAW2ZRG8_9EUKA